MKKALKILKGIAFSSLGLYVILLATMWAMQEKMIFRPSPLSQDYNFRFGGDFEEIRIKSPDEGNLHTVLFKNDTTKKVILYFHGNGGNIQGWGQQAGNYVNLGYNLVMFDYRGYGKSLGATTSEEQFYADAQAIYDTTCNRFGENNITVIGYSLGTGIASHLASKHRPACLVLQAPYYSLVDAVSNIYPFVPSFLVKYKLPTNTNLKSVKCPVTIFHGDRDQVIPYNSSERLKKENPRIQFHTLPGRTHDGLNSDPLYFHLLEKSLISSR